MQVPKSTAITIVALTLPNVAAYECTKDHNERNCNAEAVPDQVDLWNQTAVRRVARQSVFHERKHEGVASTLDLTHLNR